MYTYMMMVSTPLTSTIILHLEIECPLHKSFITNDFENSHSRQVNIVSILPRSLES